MEKVRFEILDGSVIWKQSASSVLEAWTLCGRHPADYRARDRQGITDHTVNTARFAQRFAGVFDCGNAGYFSTLLHDLGKFTRKFNEYLERSLRGDGSARRGEFIHALQGAKYMLETFQDPMMADIFGNIIASHHGGLCDAIADGKQTILKRTNGREEELSYDEAKEAFHPAIAAEAIRTEILRFCMKSQERGLSGYFMLHLLTKALYSCLVDADRCDAAVLTPAASIPDWDAMTHRLDDHLAGMENTSDPDAKKSTLNGIRNRISGQCRQSGARPLGIYTLSVPTGGGKTLSSLRFALEHARTHNLRRIIYIIPCLSILDQTAKKFREVFGVAADDWVLEHHSNIEISDDDEENQKQELLASRWGSPIVLTTMVQFLESIYSNKASKLRKFHNMSEAVLIFDEIQSLPIKCVHLFNDAVNFLNAFGKSTILLCTATQPQLDKVERPVRLSERPALVELSPEELREFDRVCPVDKTATPMSHAQIAQLAKEQLDEGKSTLVILNTRKDAREVYLAFKNLGTDCETAFLSTNLCPAHRMKVLDRVCLALREKRRVLCVSTQLIEAGVDVSFGCVIRAKAGLDSIVQAAGRCNRNKEEAPQKMFVVDVLDENLDCLPEIKEGRRQTSRVLDEVAAKQRDDGSMLNAEALDLFYKYYFFDQKSKMDFVIEHGKDGVPKATIYSLLNDNPTGCQSYRDQNSGQEYRGLPAAFQTAAEAFSVIDGGQTGIVVPYGQARELVDDFSQSFDPREKSNILKRLQKYTVNVRSHMLAKLLDDKAVKIVDGTFYFLQDSYPDSRWYDAGESEGSKPKEDSGFGLLSEPKFPFLNA